MHSENLRWETFALCHIALKYQKYIGENYIYMLKKQVLVPLQKYFPYIVTSMHGKMSTLAGLAAAGWQVLALIMAIVSRMQPHCRNSTYHQVCSAIN